MPRGECRCGSDAPPSASSGRGPGRSSRRATPNTGKSSLVSVLVHPGPGIAPHLFSCLSPSPAEVDSLRARVFGLLGVIRISACEGRIAGVESAARDVLECARGVYPVIRSFCCAAVFAFTAFPRLAMAAEADPARIVVDPDAYLGRPVTVAVKFLRIEPGSERWEGQANLNEATMIKFRVTRFGEIRCYAKRTRQNAETLAGLAKGTRLTLTGVVKRYRTKVVTKSEATGWRRRWPRKIVRTVRGHVRYAFMIDSIRRAG